MNSRDKQAGSRTSGEYAALAGIGPLARHAERLSEFRLAELYASEKRFDEFSVAACGLVLDFSRQRIDRQSMSSLFELARERKLSEWRERLFGGDPINNSENRSALHMALRGGTEPSLLIDGQSVEAQVNSELLRIQQFVEAVHSGEIAGAGGERIRNIVNIGIGGSSLGVQMAWHALRDYRHPEIELHFVSSVDGLKLADLIEGMDPAATLFVIVSKSFSTEETMANAQCARSWICDRVGEENVARHFAAVSTNQAAMDDFGIDDKRRFLIWDWVGGRYSMWSAVGLALALGIGMDNFRALLDGARSMDRHFFSAPLAENLPVIAALLDIWNINALNLHSLVVLPYTERLAFLPAHLQQLMMESLGKRVTRDDIPVEYRTGTVVWGGLGSDAQHAFMQLLHQGTHEFATEFLLPNRLPGAEARNARLNRANALGQAEALVTGRVSAGQAFRGQPGEQPVTIIGFDSVTPGTLGSLIAFYEHRTFCCATIWNINPFDQWGVELGKDLAAERSGNQHSPDLLQDRVARLAVRD